MMTIEADPGWQMTMPLTVRHSQGGDITKYRALGGTLQLVLTRSTRSQVCGNARMLCDGKPVSLTWNGSSGFGRYLVGKPRAKCLLPAGDNVTQRPQLE